MSDRNIHIAQLLSSRLCHDLMGPAGAINAGLELVSDEGGGVPAAEAFALLGQSAEEITARLNFFRVAFGAAGGRRTSGDEIAVAELRQLAADMFKTSQADIQWRTPPGGLESVRLTRGKVLLNMVLMAVDTLPRGGDVAVQTAMVSQGFGLSVSARGRGARVRDDVIDALAPDAPMEKISARNVHAYLAMALSAADGGRLTVDTTESEKVAFVALFPAV